MDHMSISRTDSDGPITSEDERRRRERLKAEAAEKKKRDPYNMTLRSLLKFEKIALISVYDKTDIEKRVRRLTNQGYGILSSGGTAKILRENKIRVCDVARLVGGGSILGHKVVTLSREVHAGLLAADFEIEELEKLGIPRIDLVAVDLYPLGEEVVKPDCTRESVIAKTDIGGPTMLSSAAKGGRIVIAHPEDWGWILQWMEDGYLCYEETINDMRAIADLVVSRYRLLSAKYHSEGDFDGSIGEKITEFKGENGYQTPAALFTTDTGDPLALDQFRVIAGTDPSYNNYCDLDRMLQTITHIAAAMDDYDGRVPAIAVAVKHGNPCGVGIDASGFGEKISLQRMVLGDPRAIFGGLVMTNFSIDVERAEILLTHGMENGRRLLDGIIAPSFSEEAIEHLKRKGDKCRFIVNPALATIDASSLDTANRFRYVRGGFLRQSNYNFVLNMDDHRLDKIIPGERTARIQVADQEMERDMLLAWAIGSTSNSNTISLVKDGMLIGNGVGQQDRVGGAELAVKRARDMKHDLSGAVAYSDSFFPFPDAVEVLIKAGVRGILASSGSVNDPKTIEVCKAANVALYLIPDSEGRGFFGH